MRHESRQSGISFDVSMSWEPNHAVLLLELVLSCESEAVWLRSFCVMHICDAIYNKD